MENIVNQQEFEAAQAESATAKPSYTHMFSPPFQYGGKTYEKAAFDFAKLKGKDYLSIQDEMRANNKYAITPSLSSDFLVLMCAKASGIGDDILSELPIADFSQIITKARSFLLKTELG